MNARRKTQAMAKTAGLFLVACTIALVIAEVFIRIIAPQRLESYRPIYEPDSLLV